MIRTLFAGLGLAFAAIILFCASFFGRLALDLRVQGPAYEKLAVDVTRDLSKRWSVADIRQYCATSASHQLGGPTEQATFAALKPLGELRYVDDIVHTTRWDSAGWTELTSPAAAAEMLTEVLNKSVRVTFVAKFANGFAKVRIALKSEGGAMKLWRLDVEGQEEYLRRLRAKPQAISRA
ncbi:MAG: hypothetical protein ABUL43_00915 [Hyphomicrobium sp.]